MSEVNEEYIAHSKWNIDQFAKTYSTDVSAFLNVCIAYIERFRSNRTEWPGALDDYIHEKIGVILAAEKKEEIRMTNNDQEETQQKKDDKLYIKAGEETQRKAHAIAVRRQEMWNPGQPYKFMQKDNLVETSVKKNGDFRCVYEDGDEIFHIDFPSSYMWLDDWEDYENIKLRKACRYKVEDEEPILRKDLKATIDKAVKYVVDSLSMMEMILGAQELEARLHHEFGF